MKASRSERLFTSRHLLAHRSISDIGSPDDSPTTAHMMEIAEVRNGHTLVMTPQGRLDALSTPEFQERLLRCIEAGERSLLLDFSGIEYISSSGLRAVLIDRKSTRLNSSHRL